jgi:hypothetical protein
MRRAHCQARCRTHWPAHWPLRTCRRYVRRGFDGQNCFCPSPPSAQAPWRARGTRDDGLLRQTLETPGHQLGRRGSHRTRQHARKAQGRFARPYRALNRLPYELVIDGINNRLGDGGALADGAAERGGNRSIGANFETLGLVRRLAANWPSLRAGAGFSRNCAAGWKWGCDNERLDPGAVGERMAERMLLS